MKQLFIILFNCLLFFFSYAQTASVNGKIYDDKSKPVVSATVSLFEASDSSLIKSVLTVNTGDYTIINIKAGAYFIAATSVGYSKETSKSFTIKNDEQYSNAIIYLLPVLNTLGSVTVQAKKAVIEVKADKTVFNVENSINATGSNAFELLEKSPGVTVDKDDNISMQGKNGVKIYVDGKPTQMNSSDLAAYLKSINSADIEAIEMITNPSAKYDAAGNAGIINIKLKKNKNYGANGSIAAGVNFGHTPKSNNSASLNYRNKKINLFSNYSNSFGKNKNLFNLYRVQNDSIYDQHTILINDENVNNFKAGIDYSLSNKSILGALVTGNLSNGNGNSNSNTFIMPASTKKLNRILFASDYLPSTRSNLDYSINYHFADTSGHTLDADADIIEFKNRGYSYQPNYYRAPETGDLLEEDIYRNNTPTDITIYTGKIDYEQNFYRGKLGYGIKITDVKTKNTSDFFDVLNNVDVKDFNLSNKFNYDEDVKAAYINYNRPFNKKLNLQAGVRMENTESKGDLISETLLPDNMVKRHYTDFFPSGALTYALNQKNTLNLSYSKRIDRPTYQDLNPFEQKIDELTYRKGNAFLNPQYTNSFTLSHTFLYKYVTSLSYSHVKDYFAQVIDTVGNATFITQRNLAQQNIISINFSAPITITKWWNVFATLNAYNSGYKAHLNKNENIHLVVNAFSLYAQQTFTIQKGPSFELSSFCNSPTVWGGTFKTRALGFIDAGVQQKILKGAGTIKLSFTDVFNSLHWKAKSNYGGTNIIADGHPESQQLKINFSYRFGNNNVKAARQRKNATDEENNRLNGSGGIGKP